MLPSAPPRMPPSARRALHCAAGMLPSRMKITSTASGRTTLSTPGCSSNFPHIIPGLSVATKRSQSPATAIRRAGAASWNSEIDAYFAGSTSRCWKTRCFVQRSRAKIASAAPQKIHDVRAACGAAGPSRTSALAFPLLLTVHAVAGERQDLEPRQRDRRLARLAHAERRLPEADQRLVDLARERLVA